MYSEDEIANYENKMYKKIYLTQEGKDALRLKIMAGDKKAKDEFIKANLKLVAYVVKQLMCNKKSNCDFQYEELFQEGCIWLVDAFNKFDFSKSTSFESFASKHIFWHLGYKAKQKELLMVPGWEYDTYLLSSFNSDEDDIDNIIEKDYIKQQVSRIIKEGLLDNLLNTYSKETLSKIFEFCRLYKLVDNKPKETDNQTMIKLEKAAKELMNEIDYVATNDELFYIFEKVYTKLRRTDIIMKRIMAHPEDMWSLEECANFYGVTYRRISMLTNDAIIKMKDYIYNNIDDFGYFFENYYLNSETKKHRLYKKI